LNPKKRTAEVMVHLPVPDKPQVRGKWFALISDLKLRGSGAGFNKNIQQNHRCSSGLQAVQVRVCDPAKSVLFMSAMHNPWAGRYRRTAFQPVSVYC
jgi:hypothetical protein